MGKNRIKVSLRSLLAAVFATIVLVSGTAAPLASAEPSTWNWADTSAESWADYLTQEGPMMWGDIYDSVEFQDDMYFAMQDSENNGRIWHFDTSSGDWNEEDLIADGFDAGTNSRVLSLAVHGGNLYAGTNNNADYGQIWMLDGTSHNWSKVFDFEDRGIEANAISSLVTYNGNLCFSTYDSDPQVWCRISNTWTDLQLDSAGASLGSDRKLTVIGGNLYIDAQTDDGYHEIWRYNGTAWSMLATPFTDETETNEERTDDVIATGVFAGKLIAISQDDSSLTHVWQLDGSSWEELGGSNFGGGSSIEYGDAAEVVTHDGKLVVGIGSYSDGVKIWEYDGVDAWTQRNDDFFGIPDQDGVYRMNGFASLTVTDDAIYASVFNISEGDIYPRVWRTPPFEGSDGDSDPQSGGDSEEVVGDDGPNNGDANADGAQDSGQANVKTLLSGLTNKYSVLEVSSGCSIDEVGLRRETDLAAKDSGYEYPNGLMRFAVSCGTPGFTTTVSQYYYDFNASGHVLRKFHPVNNAFFTITDAQLKQASIGGHNVAKVTYQVTDGGQLDIDGEVNGVIVDPAGLGAGNVAAPDTGVQTVKAFLFKQ